jgi:hypothetical protein
MGSIQMLPGSRMLIQTSHGNGERFATTPILYRNVTHEKINSYSYANHRSIQPRACVQSVRFGLGGLFIAFLFHLLMRYDAWLYCHTATDLVNDQAHHVPNDWPCLDNRVRPLTQIPAAAFCYFPLFPFSCQDPGL